MTVTTGNWKTIFASMIGTSHEAAETPCQDYCDVRTIEIGGEQIVLAVCSDGAGSCRNSDLGSKVVCREFLSYMSTLVTLVPVEDISDCQVQECVKLIRCSLQQEADHIQVDTKELAATLIGAVIGPCASVFIQIGDGAFVYRADERLQTAFWPQSGEYANTTNFITSSNWELLIEWRTIHVRIDEFVGFTDGLERLLLQFEDQTVFEPSIEPMLDSIASCSDPSKYLEPLRAFLRSRSVNERTDDDKSLIVASRLNRNDQIS